MRKLQKKTILFFNSDAPLDIIRAVIDFSYASCDYTIKKKTSRVLLKHAAYVYNERAANLAIPNVVSRGSYIRRSQLNVGNVPPPADTLHQFGYQDPHTNSIITIKKTIFIVIMNILNAIFEKLGEFPLFKLRFNYT